LWEEGESLDLLDSCEAAAIELERAKALSAYVMEYLRYSLQKSLEEAKRNS